MPSNRRLSLRAALAAIALSIAAPAFAQGAYPDKPIRLLVGFAAGSGSDTVARFIAPRVAAALNQTVVVENRAGAGGAIAAEAVAKAPPDGLTWILVPSGHATQAAMRKTLPFDPVKDFAWVSTITTYPMLIAVRPDSPYRTLGDVLAAARQQAGKVSYSSVGIGTAHHLIGEWLNAEGKVEMTHVPFKGAGLALTEVLAGRVDLLIDTMTFGLGHVQSGQLRALAVSSGEAFPRLPGVPTVMSTVPAVQYESWLGIAVAPNTPAPIVARINSELQKVLAQPETQAKLAELGGRAAPSTPEQFRQRVERDIGRFAHIVQTRRIERE